MYVEIASGQRLFWGGQSGARQELYVHFERVIYDYGDIRAVMFFVV